MIKVIAFSVELAGCPIAVGGANSLIRAFERLIGDQGGEIRSGADVEKVLLDNGGRAIGVKLFSGETIMSRKGVICSMTPAQLYRRLLSDSAPPPEIAAALRRYRHGKGDMQVHYALDAPPRWNGGEDLGKVALLHVTPGLDGVSRAANEAERGLLPAEPTICVGQPTALDPSRAPDGKAILWLQLPEAPRFLKGDAAGEIVTPADGRWTPAVRDAYADRVEALFSRHIKDFKKLVIARKAYSPADLSRSTSISWAATPMAAIVVSTQFVGAPCFFSESPHPCARPLPHRRPRPIPGRASEAARVSCSPAP